MHASCNLGDSILGVSPLLTLKNLKELDPSDNDWNRFSADPLCKKLPGGNRLALLDRVISFLTQFPSGCKIRISSEALPYDSFRWETKMKGTITSDYALQRVENSFRKENVKSRGFDDYILTVPERPHATL